jgi:ABC-type bacteriocin/lantibiotic exporter with double-glycine peptidase domain
VLLDGTPARRRARTGLGAAGLCALAAAGCYTGAARDVTPAEIATDSGWLLVRGVPFVPQQNDDDCGAAALAMVLTYLRVPTSREAVVIEAHPRAGGITAGELRQVARGKGLDAFVLKATWNDIEDQLRRGRPLVVGLLKPILTERSVAHFEVVIGFNRLRRQILTLDPARGLREISAEGFAREWAPAGQVALFVLPPAGGLRLASSSAQRS